MSNIRKAFENGKAFIPFITCGDPDLETTAKVVMKAVENGADLIELGIPFSDPTAEGPVIQGANIRALSGGIKTDHIFAFVRVFRQISLWPEQRVLYAGILCCLNGFVFITEDHSFALFAIFLHGQVV